MDQDKQISPDSETIPTPEEKKKSQRKELLSWVYTVVVPVVVILLLNAFVGKLIIVNGSSMYPTLHNHDLMIVRTIAYTPAKQDIVVVKTDRDGILGGENIVKRCIATAGDSIRIDYDTNTVYVNDVALSEPYINQEEADIMERDYADTDLVVPDGYIFVMGDNRNNSTDSRDPRLGVIPVDTVLGKEVVNIPFGKLFSSGSGS